MKEKIGRAIDAMLIPFVILVFAGYIFGVMMEYTPCEFYMNGKCYR